MRSECHRFPVRPVLAVAAVCLLLALLPAPDAAAESHDETNPYPCAAEKSWVTDPEPPMDIPDGGADFCDFYQFAWQWFLFLGYPDYVIVVEGRVEEGPDRIFQDTGSFPEWEGKSTSSCNTTAATASPSLFIRDVKDDEEGEATDVIIPDRTGQAGGGAVIYDQRTNVVYYNVQFNRDLCAFDPSSCTSETDCDLPAGTTELKTAWRLLDGDGSGYFTWNVVIAGVNNDQPVDLGLVGFHLFRTTQSHPEGVWMTWEHKDNNPDCTDPQAAPAGGWSFTSANCAACLDGGGSNCPECNFNVADTGTDTPRPTEICRVYPYGTKEGDKKAEENLTVLKELNDQLVGPDGFVSQLPPEHPMAVWANYFMVGGLWVSNPSQPATDKHGNDNGNQRGSLQLTNTTLETTFQGGNGSSSVNCFACHGYTPGKTATTGLSHIFNTIHGSSGANAKAAHEGAHELRFIRAQRPTAEAGGADRE